MSKRKRDSSSARVVSYGLLLYKCDANERDSKNSIRFLLGLIPQRNWWTVFKGLPEPNETPYETALREFHEETGIAYAFGLTKSPSSKASAEFRPETTLHAKVGTAKDLKIFLIDGSHVEESSFDVSKVVKIDQGYMKGRPEIVAIRWLTLEQALDGIDGAKIYTSQQELLREAHCFVKSKNSKKNGPLLEDDDESDGSDV